MIHRKELIEQSVEISELRKEYFGKHLDKMIKFGLNDYE